MLFTHNDLISLLFLIAFLLLYGASLRWVYQDAKWRGHAPGQGVVFVMVACWPLSLSIWLVVRSSMSIGYQDAETVWG
jgi:hypothetical protein